MTLPDFFTPTVGEGFQPSLNLTKLSTSAKPEMLLFHNCRGRVGNPPLRGIPAILKNSDFLLELTKFTYNCP